MTEAEDFFLVSKFCVERDKRVARMTPEARELYGSIMALRDEIGPLGIDIVQMLREMRGDEETAPAEAGETLERKKR